MAAVVVSRCCSFALLEPVHGVSMGETAPPVVYKRFICSFADCNAAYNKNWKLLAHLCKHTGEKPFPCTYEGCDKGFTSLFHLNRHILTHTGEKPFKCDAENCSLSFTTPSNMRKHFKRAHASPAQVYVCYVADCGKEFKKHNQLKIHQYIHTNQQPFKCTHEGCDKRYSSPSHLKRHEKTHAGYRCQKDSACPFVGKTWSEYLKHAANVHSDVTCSVCNRTFKNKGNLKDHKQVHKGERIVFCCPRENCDRSYTTKFNLRNHILAFHEGVRQFVCEHEGCGKTFVMRQSLDRHVNTHNPEKKKMVKVKPPRPVRSLASRLSGYKPKSSSKKKKKSSSKTPALESIKKPPDVSRLDSLLVLENLSL
ncbi:transcription factor IIIA [Hyla sarda]|uniref:transcription factor IIIA n=1 Tax=Hyla sarda TaxID=327740 RepID=UPI0024C274D2|nr:transcription factor IIIA [Hyla sarda]